ncbi:hypothetical protein NFI96_002243 [Prochilodus magdalenae]|nr:hypothetical protein NFI96_002243 [Prochilodus magdalenae]
MLDEKAWLSVSTLVHPKGVLSGRGAGQSSSSTPDSLIHVFMELALCTAVQSCWNRKGFTQIWEHEISMQSDKYRYPGTQTRPSDCQSRSVIGHSREHASTALESRGGALHHCIPRSALRLVITVFRACFFIMYLVTPAFIAFTLAWFYALSHSEGSATNVPANRRLTEDPENPQRNRQQQRPWKRTSIFTLVEWLQCLIPSVIWVILFLSDGRYVACLSTTLEGENADSSVHPAWEWCDHNRTLTDNQKNAQRSFYVSKFLSNISLLHCRPFKNVTTKTKP